MIKRFLRYSLENEKKIAVVLLQDGRMEKKNLRVTALSADGESFTALLSGRKKETVFPAADILTADYARGDHGELE